jgi:subtilisin-like proprotein convertase family protein
MKRQAYSALVCAAMVCCAGVSGASVDEGSGASTLQAPGRLSDSVETAPGVYIVQLEGEPLATYRGGVDRLAATSPAVTGARKLDPRSAASIAYERHLESLQQTFVDQLEVRLGRSVDLRFQYRHAYHGLALVLDPDEVRTVAAMPGVLQVEREREEQLLSDAGPRFIGATALWGGGFSDAGYRTALSGTNEVPPVATGASGSGEFSYNLNTRKLDYSISTTGLAGVTAAHIHVGTAGTNGAVAHSLDHTVNPMVGSVTLSPAHQTALANAGLYVNVHTAANPGGEIRGQIVIGGNRGEGIVIGMIDSGINHDHPAFAAVAADGYQHQNPNGPGVHLGYCASNPGFCNDKLIGAWVLHPTPATPEDLNGHGSHTASTAAGNVLPGAQWDAPTRSFVFPFVSGVAPRANLIAYLVCSPSCPTSSTTAAVNQAVIDGVDVINYSISGGTNPYVETTAVAFRNAAAAGVLVVASAGNAGPSPSTVGHQAPWVMTVGAADHSRSISATLGGLVGDAGALPDISGEGPTAGYSGAIVYAGAPPYGNPLCNPAPPGTFSGQIVVCDRGLIGRVQKGANVLAAGAGGMIVANDLPNAASLNADAHVLPAVHVSYADGLLLKDWLAAATVASGTISGGTVDNQRVGDSMFSLSARGPATTMVETIKPDITAPGANILAAYNSTGNPPPPEFNIISGTSTSAPHVAGAGALMRARHPDWTPAEIKSALMITAWSGITREDGVTAGNTFDYGSGRVELRLAQQAGFVLDVSDADYVAANPATGGDPRLLNLPGMANSQCTDSCTWTRTLRSVLPTSQSYNAAVLVPAGASGSVSPASFTLAPGATQALTITFVAGTIAANTWTFADVLIEPTGAAASRKSLVSFDGAPALPIPDNQYAGGFGGAGMACHGIDTATIQAGSTVTAAQVELTASHTWIGDLVIKLRSPDGSILGLMSRPGAAEPVDDGSNGAWGVGDSSNLVATHPVTFLDAGRKDAELMGNTIGGGLAVCRDDSACDYLSNPGSIVGLAGFGGFAGEAAAGVWTLCIGDSASDDVGVFEAWKLTLGFRQPLPVPAVADARLPIALRAQFTRIFANGFESP